MFQLVLFLYFIISCITDDTPKAPLDVNSFDAAIKIMTEQKSASKSLCLINGISPTKEESDQIKAVLLKIMEKKVTDQDVEKAISDFIEKYQIARRDHIEVEKILYGDLLGIDCQVTDPKGADPIQHIITEFNDKKAKLSTLASPLLMVVSCELEKIYNVDLTYLASDTRGKERRIAEMSYVNQQMKNSITKATDEGVTNHLILNTEMYIKKVSKITKAPHQHVIKCLLQKTETLYKSGPITYVGGVYKIILDELNERETCDISKLPAERQTKFSELIAASKLAEFSPVEIKALIVAFEELFQSYDTVDIFGNFGFLQYLDTFLNFADCTFDFTKFTSEYKDKINGILALSFGTTKLENIGQAVAVYCPLAQIKNKQHTDMDKDISDKLQTILDVYTFMLGGPALNTNKAFAVELFKHMSAVRGDSKRLNDYLGQDWFNKVKYRCTLGTGETQFVDRFQPTLIKLDDFVNNVYSPSHCQNSNWDINAFVDEISILLFGVHDEQIISFKFVYENIMKMLDRSTDSKDIFWTNILRFEGKGQCSKIPVDYFNFTQNKYPEPVVDLASFEKSIVTVCSNIKSLAKAYTEVDQKLSVFDRTILYSTYIQLSKTVPSFDPLSFDQKLKLLASSADNKTEAFTKGPGRRAFLHCESFRVIALGYYYENELYFSLYSLIVNSYLDSRTCCYLSGTFSDVNRRNVSLILMKHPELTKFSVNEIIQFFHPLFKIISQHFNEMLSYFSTPPQLIMRFINNKTCTFDETNDTKLSQDITDFYNELNKNENFNKTEDQFPFQSSNVVQIYTCYSLKEIKSVRDKLEDKQKLLSTDITFLNEVSDKVMNEYPNLKLDKSHENFVYLFANVTKNEKFKELFSNSLKLSLAECNVGLNYFKDSTNNGGDTNGSAGNKLSPGAIAGIVIGTICGLVILIALVVFFVRSRRK